ncbi:hypothetical protein ABTL64_19195, partial [Acinetobacter baumannii]
LARRVQEPIDDLVDVQAFVGGKLAFTGTEREPTEDMGDAVLLVPQLGHSLLCRMIDLVSII